MRTVFLRVKLKGRSSLSSRTALWTNKRWHRSVVTKRIGQRSFHLGREGLWVLRKTVSETEGRGGGVLKPLCYRDSGSIRLVSLETGMDRRKQYELNFLDSAGPIWNQMAMASKRLSYIPQGKGLATITLLEED